MTISSNLMKAILSMDAYNRGYDAGLSYLSSDTILGNASINYTSSTLLDDNGQLLFDDSSIGFYAVSYQYDSNNDGTVDETVISYRGNDYPQNDTFRDITHGWTLGAGITSSQQGHNARSV